MPLPISYQIQGENKKNILGIQGIKTKVKDIDLRDYAKYLLKEGSVIEKRQFLSCMKSKFVIARGIVAVEKQPKI